MSIDPIDRDTFADPTRFTQKTGGENFAETVTRALKDANSDQVGAAEKIKELMLEGEGSIHDTMVAMSNAEGSFRLMMEIRNRMIEAVNRLLQTQV
jgi:flagellar hook-basal body complex protein FliE